MPPSGKGALQALEKRIAETEKLIANTQTAMMRMELRPGMQQAIQEARVRWWTENIPDAVQTARDQPQKRAAGSKAARSKTAAAAAR